MFSKLFKSSTVKTEPTEQLKEINNIEAENVNPVVGRHKKHRNSVQSEQFRNNVWMAVRLGCKNRDIARYYNVTSNDVATAKVFLKKNGADLSVIPSNKRSTKQRNLYNNIQQGTILETKTRREGKELIGTFVIYKVNGKLEFVPVNSTSKAK